MKKRILAAVLALVLCVSMLAACGGSTAPATTAAPAETTAAGGGDDTTAAPETEATTEELGDPVELKVLMLHVIGSIEDSDKVEAAINEYILPKINATVDLEWMDLGDYVGQINVKLASGEVYDVLPSFSQFLPGLYASESILPLDDLIAQYGPDIADSVGESYLKAGQINGVQYSIPIVAAFAQNSAFIYRTDIAEEMGLDFSNVKTIYDLEPIFEQVQAAHPELTMVCCNSFTDPQLREWSWDGLNDEYGVLMDPTNDTTVVDLFETDEYMDYCKLMRQWYVNGYTQEDAATCTEMLTTLFDSGLYFGTIAKDYPGNLEEKFSTAKYMMGAVPLTTAIGTTTYTTNNAMVIPVTAEQPEAAMKFINLLYSDEYIQNLVCYGIEGEHYRVVDGKADFLEGEDIMTAKYVSKFNIGNHLLSYNAVWDPENIHEELIKWNNEADKSLALGFAYDSSSVANELTALANVCAKYRRNLECGSVDPETEMPKFIEELKAAGIDDVIALKQEQLDAWLAQ